MMDPKTDKHASLKHQLLGPSSSKAGLQKSNQGQISEIIYNVSKGTKFFQREEDLDRVRSGKIKQILDKKAALESRDLTREYRVADEHISRAEASRDLSQTIVHIDCDAFYAAVEELDRPELKTVPFAVGTSVLSTCNYVARQRGVRSGMAAFVAKKVCPELICLPESFDKYKSKAEQVRAVLARYDPRFESASIDEAYLNLTTYCADDEAKRSAWQIVNEIRTSIFEATGLTVSAGIAANARLAKISSDQNKPNGQFEIPRNRHRIIVFTSTLPVRKVFGIGRVTERELDSIGIHTLSDVFDNRAVIGPLFGDRAMKFLLDAYLGLGRTDVVPSSDRVRKSVGTERTFADTASPVDIRNRLANAAGELEKVCRRDRVKGKTLTLRLKLHSYEVLTRQTRFAPGMFTGANATPTAAEFYKLALGMLEKVEAEMAAKKERLKIRLLGLRVGNLTDQKVGPMDAYIIRS